MAATAPRANIVGLAQILGVTPQTVSRWHRRGAFHGQRSMLDHRKVLFNLPEVRRAIDFFALPVDPERVNSLDAMLVANAE